MAKKAGIDLELDHIREINRILSRKPAAAAVLDRGKVIKEFSVEVDPGINAVVSVIFSPSGAWVRAVLSRGARIIQELPPCFEFIDRSFHFVSTGPGNETFDYLVDVAPATFLHRYNKFVRKRKVERRIGMDIRGGSRRLREEGHR